MKVTYLHQYFATPSMSGGTRSYEFAKRLVARGHDVTVVTSWQEPRDSRDWFTSTEDGIAVHWLPVPYSNAMDFSDRVRSFARFAFGAAERAAQLPCDVIVATSTPLTIALPGVYAARRRRVPMVFEVRDLWPEMPIAVGALRNPLAKAAAYRLERWAYQSAAAVVALSDDMADGVRKQHPTVADLTVIPNAADLELFRPDPERGQLLRRRLGVRDDQLLVTYAGTFGVVNDVAYLVRLAAELRKDDRFHFLTVGAGRQLQDVRALAENLGVLRRNLTMMDGLPKAEMPDVLAATDIATSLFAPIKEMEANSANKFFDGLSAGCGMAVNYGGWQATLLEETGAGLRLSREISVAARQLQALAEDRGRLAQMRKASRRLAEERFSRDRLAMQFEQVLERAVRAGTT